MSSGDCCPVVGGVGVVTGGGCWEAGGVAPTVAPGEPPPPPQPASKDIAAKEREIRRKAEDVLMRPIIDVHIGRKCKQL